MKCPSSAPPSPSPTTPTSNSFRRYPKKATYMPTAPQEREKKKKRKYKNYKRLDFAREHCLGGIVQSAAPYYIVKHQTRLPHRPHVSGSRQPTSCLLGRAHPDSMDRITGGRQTRPDNTSNRRNGPCQAPPRKASSPSGSCAPGRSRNS